ncbi:hypothetical protein HUA78_00065 [Myxococcus sp. CA033]|uniref:hypothetical protein n=1 Tax=Myxococcus sp. CA033 TaxID=2741516 RepID=UPI00157A94C5|nr:hypothetical protein [Myxococcus sp. CA033]NTX32824.1 hypothetical protein [Myxococcus sp. CA033]
MFTWPHLDSRTRQLMLDEIEADERAGKLYFSSKLSPHGRQNYPHFLREAVQSGNEATLTSRLSQAGQLNTRQVPRMNRGGFSIPTMNSNAAEMLAEGEFNRFYIRALCRRAIEDDLIDVVIFRAKVVERPRPESERKIGRAIAAKALLDDLRDNIGDSTRFGIPEPGSGLSVRLP